MTKNNEQDVLSTIEIALEIAPGSVALDAVADNVEGWDSIGHLSVLMALDKIFEGKVANINEIAEANSVPKILEALRKHSLI